MKVEILEQRVLTAADGCYLTNGETFGKVVTMPMSADVSVWHEVTEEEKQMLEQACGEIKE